MCADTIAIAAGGGPATAGAADPGQDGAAAGGAAWSGSPAGAATGVGGGRPGDVAAACEAGVVAVSVM
ncbi:MAG TPA: hypothetical protein VL595_19450 [Pseudonocardia sp.]|jgi:hypothetical protein|nr:hypothetical protein [Pseudonocardia sp.]